MLNRPADVGGQYCPCPALVSFLSGFSGNSCPVSVCCPESVWYLSVQILSVSILSAVWILSGILYKNAVRCLSVRIFSVSILSPIRIQSDFYGENAVRCLSVRADKDETELSGLSLSLSADVCPISSQKKFHLGYIKLTL